MNNKASAVRPIFVVEIIVRIAVILLSIGMIYWYLDSGFIGFGSIIGIGFFSSAALCAVFFRFIKALARLMKRSKAGRIIFWVMISLLILFIIYVITALCLMFSGSAKEPEKDATVIVLGCQVNGTEPSYTLHMRLNTAYDYLNANPQAKAILSGGQGEHEKISEAECMYRFLTEKGISPDRLYKEERSTTTDENIRYSSEIIRKNGMSENTAIVTDWYHEYRAGKIASRNGLNPGAVSAPTARFVTANLVTREIFAIALDIFK